MSETFRRFQGTSLRPPRAFPGNDLVSSHNDNSSLAEKTHSLAEKDTEIYDPVGRSSVPDTSFGSESGTHSRHGLDRHEH